MRRSKQKKMNGFIHPGLNNAYSRNGKQAAGKLERRSRLVAAAKELLWLDRDTTAAYIGIGRTHLDTLDIILKPSKLGRRKIYNRQRVNEYLERCAGIKPQQPSMPLLQAEKD